MFIEQFGKVFKSSSPKNDKDNANPELAAVDYYQRYYREHEKFPLFSQVLIETRTDCNRKCAFCPQAFTQRPFKEMTWDVFQEIIQQLARLEFSGRITFGVTNEPLLDERMGEMLVYARKMSPRFFLDMTTNGNLLTLDSTDRLFAAGLDNMNVNDYRPDREEHPEKLSRNLEPVNNAYALNPKISFSYRSTREVLSSRGGHVDKKTENVHLYSFCNYPLRKLVLSPHGDVVLCCMDYDYNVKFGNVSESSLEDIWFSEALNDYRWMLLKRKREKICAKCDAYQY